ncbi:PC-esterase domain-containing protein 1B-like isoform X7 [Dermacentor albipictus]|uniref:PC-esterase domain-containing protein 1B-like isoform X7 n=1 Tax=Dermacentor albipictus TaxID=60249 RepID=UPI0038FD0F64
MPYVFTSECVRSLLRTKRLAFLGCSNVRDVYKDLVCLYQENSLISSDLLKQKMEESCLGDYLVDHGKQNNGQGYLEERIFCNDHTTIYFYFLTKIYSEYVQTVLTRMADISPDVVIVSSCLWDITRWGPCGVDEYKKNLHLFFGELRRVLPQSSIAIWLTAAPPSQNVHGGFLVPPELDFLKYTLRFHVNEANYFCQETASKFGVDVVDIHYYLRMMLEYRDEDGIHWHPVAVRLCTNLILTHLALSWGEELPNSCGFLTASEKRCSANAIDVSEESGTDDSYLSEELSQSNIFGSELAPQESRYNDAFDYEGFAMKQEPKRVRRSRLCAGTRHRLPGLPRAGESPRERSSRPLPTRRSRRKTIGQPAALRGSARGIKGTFPEEADRGSPRSDLTHSDTVSSGEEIDRGSPRFDLTPSDSSSGVTCCDTCSSDEETDLSSPTSDVTHSDSSGSVTRCDTCSSDEDASSDEGQTAGTNTRRRPNTQGSTSQRGSCQL